MKRAFGVFAAAAAAFAAITGLALEWSGVAVVTTRTAAGAPRATHVWFADIDGEIWLEAGAPENPWFQDAQANPRLQLALPGAPLLDVVAVPDASAEAKRRVREALHAKYGWRDAWVGLFVDAARSLPVRAAAVEPPRVP